MVRSSNRLTAQTNFSSLRNVPGTGSISAILQPKFSRWRGTESEQINDVELGSVLINMLTFSLFLIHF